jgi:hypothetical protein
MANSIFKGSRYETVREFTPIVDTETGKVRNFLHNRRVLSKRDIGQGFFTHVVKVGELLDGIAYIYYGLETLWWVIADINDLFYIFDIFPGQILIVPTLDSVYGITENRNKPV